MEETGEVKEEGLKVGDIVGFEDSDLGNAVKTKDDHQAKMNAIAHKRAQLQNLSTEKDIEIRERYAKYVFWLVVGWLGLLGVIIILQGFGTAWGFFSLETQVLEWSIVTLGVNVLGLMFMVVRYLFNSPAGLLFEDKKEELEERFSLAKKKKGKA